ncbi:MAG: hypothetical protein EOP49_09195, partial [Sphingobacteriales bacterium]
MKTCKPCIRPSAGLTIITLVLLLSVRAHLCAQDYLQPQNKVWVFGNHNSWDFNQPGAPQISDNAMPVFSNLDLFSNTTACVSGADGNLLFYTEGNKVWNRNHQLMPNGTNLAGAGTAPVGRWPVIVPEPGSAYRYYIFYTAVSGMGGNLACRQINNLYYSIIDMRLQQGSGDVVGGSKCIKLDTMIAECSIAAVAGNNCNLWLVTHALNKNVYSSWNITKDGISSAPVNSQVGDTVLTIPGFAPASVSDCTTESNWSDNDVCTRSWFWISSTLHFSSDRQRLILTAIMPNPEGSFIEYADFNPSTGVVTNSTSVYY